MATEIPDNILSRMKALEAMAERGTTHEAETAAGMLADLLARFDIDKVPSERDEPYGRVDFPIEEAIWRQLLLDAAATSVGCRTVKGVYIEGKHHMAIVGQKSNIDIAKYTYEVLARTVEKLGANLPKGVSRTYRTSFRVGAATTVRAKMREARKATQAEATPGEQGLIVVTEQALSDAFRRAFPRTTRSHSMPGDSTAYALGRKAGEGISVNPGVTGGGKGAPVAALKRG